MNQKIAIVTGATGGIGKEFMKAMCKEDVDEIWAIARNEQKLKELQKLDDKRIRILSVDLSQKKTYTLISGLLESEKPVVKFLINNAGVGKMAACVDFSMEELENAIDLNCKTPVILSRVCIPYMTSGSRLLNICSAAAFQPTPYINLYSSSKAFDRYFSRALNVELKETGITVTAVCPSWVDTEMLTKEINGKKVKFPGLVTPKQVVAKAMKDAKRGKDMSVCSFYVKCQHFNAKILPQSIMMKIWMRGIKKYR